ncbi:acetyl-CoA carboxylase biotin carboxylase subunit [Aerococcus sp. 1KP-2016]|uniref:acetyl-CoA carboxylase biotin carboxylase subunit n=1 Tax=Aerococcus sp. 1KP-2016 TaxID=1981982 RepID=UPI000B987614|nr:acetyl-CoA carboxylase biotin carboxylase subunit [Aerococcus sp. 1KP-2016]OYQ68145.1 acetyl-CoA carboxylase biotin carboxylase subunit [Aerococcus sp. 1KP-2016]
MIKKVLIANRGEIAVRIIRTCIELGIETVAVYSAADKDALHVKLADEAVCIGGPKSADSYLNMQSILSAAVVTNVQAIHPGFGFLAENSKFARLCKEMNIEFIGPSPEVIDLMGDKQNARDTMKKAHVQTVPGSDGILENPESGIAQAKKVGYPVLLKATAGGGGKGMRMVYDEDQFIDAYYEASREAQNAFGDNRLYMEKVIHPAHHIEVQVLGDKFGHVIHLGERECSMQRNHQKVIEETPSPFISEATRMKVTQAAVRAAEQLQYESAGTIEFLVDNDQNYYFMEMNTRIQVEHPITEMVTGVDIVAEQLRVASGLPLSYEQADIQFSGHALECRINAEMPEKNFMPASGSFDTAHFPAGGLGIRVDSAIYAGYKLPPYYDSMVAKLITHGDNRAQAINRMLRAVSEMTITGIATNQQFQYDLLFDEAFLKGNYTNDYLETNFLPNWLQDHQTVTK